MGNRCSIFSRGMEFTRAHCHARRGTQKMGVPCWRILVLGLLRSFLCVLENVYLSSFHYTAHSYFLLTLCKLSSGCKTM